MKRKRAIKLIAAADGNGEVRKAGKLLDMYHSKGLNNEQAVLCILQSIALQALFYMDGETYKRCHEIMKLFKGKRKAKTDSHLGVKK